MINDVALFKTNLGKHVAELREKAGLTQPELGALIGKDYQSISRLERGKVNVSGFMMAQLAEALKIDMNQLFNFKKS